MFYLHWLDEGFPAGPSEDHPNTRRAGFGTVKEAVEQAAHDLAFAGAIPVALLNGKGRDVLDRGKVLARACRLIDEHHAPLVGALPDDELRTRVDGQKADAEKRSGV